jgi:hypothetical protein
LEDVWGVNWILANRGTAYYFETVRNTARMLQTRHSISTLELQTIHLMKNTQITPNALSRKRQNQPIIIFERSFPF